MISKRIIQLKGAENFRGAFYLIPQRVLKIEKCHLYEHVALENSFPTVYDTYVYLSWRRSQRRSRTRKSALNQNPVIMTASRSQKYHNAQKIH